MAEFLPRLRQGVPIGQGPDGKDVFPSPNLILLWQTLVETLEQIPGLEEAIASAEAAAAAANAAADNAQEAADSTTSASSLANSYVEETSPPLISADSTGNVTIATHNRIYGDSTLNPTVLVDGALLGTGEPAGTALYFYYLDPDRAGGTVDYLFSANQVDAAQVGDTHSVGSLTIPFAGTETGAYVRPPGYALKTDTGV